MSNSFGYRLKIAVKSVGLTQKKLAEMLGVSQDTVTHYTKNTIPRADILYKISRICGVSMEWLLTGKKNEPVRSREDIKPIKKGVVLTSIMLNFMVLYLTHVLDECKYCDERKKRNSNITCLLRLSQEELAKLIIGEDSPGLKMCKYFEDLTKVMCNFIKI